MQNIVFTLLFSASLAFTPLNVNIDDVYSGPAINKNNIDLVQIANHSHHNILMRIKSYNSKLSQTEINRIITSVNKYGQKYGVPTDIIYAVIAAESRFDTNCHGVLDDLGLMQVREKYAPGWVRGMDINYQGRKSLLDIEDNIHIGTYILSYLMNRYDGNLHKVLIGYNWGHGHVDRVIENNGDLPTGYINLIKKHYENLFGMDVAV